MMVDRKFGCQLMSILSLLGVCCFIWVVTVSWDSHFSSLPKHMKAWSMTSGEFSDASGKLVTRYHWRSFSDNRLIKPCTMFRRVPREQHRRNSWEPGGFIVVLFYSEASILNWLVYTNLAMIAMEIDPFLHPDKPGSFICTFYQWYCVLSPLKRLRLDFPSKFYPAMCRSQNSDIAFRVRKEKERSISELIFDLRRARQAAGANVPDFCGGEPRGALSIIGPFHPTLKKQAKCMKKWWLMFWDLFLLNHRKGGCKMWPFILTGASSWGTLVMDRSWKLFFFRGSPCGCMIGYLHCIEGVHGSFVKHLLGKGYSMIFCLK